MLWGGRSAGGRLPRSTMLEIFLLISYRKRHACARSLEASCRAARCRWQLFGWQQCVHYMLCAPRPIVRRCRVRRVVIPQPLRGWQHPPPQAGTSV